jgi:acyl carrier protein
MENEIMSELEIFEALKPLLNEVLGVRPEIIQMNSQLVTDLGAESIDLLDLSFRIEDQFKITIGPNEIENDARKRLPGGTFEKNGFLTTEAVDELKRILPDANLARMSGPLRKSDLPSLLTVGFFVRLIHQKLMAAPGGSHA